MPLHEDGISLILARRDRQIAKGYGADHDNDHTDGVLWKTAGWLIANNADATFDSTVKPSDADWVEELVSSRAERIDALVEAGAFIVAEINRLLREKRRVETGRD